MSYLLKQIIKKTSVVRNCSFVSFFCVCSLPRKTNQIGRAFCTWGGTDSIARTLAVGMSQGLGQQVVVENKAGGGTIIGTDAVAKV